MATPVLRRAVLALVLIAAGASAFAADEPAMFTVIAPVTDLHRYPTDEAEVVSQSIFSSTVVLVEAGDGWMKVRTPDQYQGWVNAEHLVPVQSPYARGGKAAVVSSLFAALYREADIEKHEPAILVPFESLLEITGEQQTADGLFYTVRMPQGWTLWVQSGDVELDPGPLTIASTIELARRFLGLPYRWGGTTAFGFDCSGFTQMLMRQRGLAMPRDSRPQAQWEGLVPVDRTELLPGDLLFFGKTPERINHTGMYLGAGEFIHATRRGRPAVQIGVLAAEPWTSQYITARRAK